MKKYKTKINRQQLEGMERLVMAWIESHSSRDLYDRMHVCLLAEVVTELSRKRADPFKRDFSVTWTASQALAMQLFFLQLLADESILRTYEGNCFMRLANEIDQLFS